MNNELQNSIEKYAERMRKKRRRNKVLSVFAVLTVLCTISVLTLPALAMGDGSTAASGNADISYEAGEWEVKATDVTEDQSNTLIEEREKQTTEKNERKGLLSTEFSSDLADFVLGFLLKDKNGVPVDGGVYVGEDYSLEIRFSELNELNNSRQFQYDGDGYLTYQFDTSNLVFNGVGTTTIFDSENGSLPIGELSIDSTGLMKVRFFEVDKNGNSTPGIVYFDHYPNTSLKVNMWVTVSNSDEDERLIIDLGNNIQINVEAPRTAELNVTKSSSNYFEAYHRVDYTVKVECIHGIVTDLVFTDVATVRENQVDYSLEDGKFHYENIVIKDLEGNPVTDENGDPITDISLLPDTLKGKEGYLITYSIVLDPSLCTGDTYSVNQNNVFTATGKDIEGRDVGAADSASANFTGTNISKSGVPSGTVIVDGIEYRRINWTVSVGDYYHVYDGPVTITDILGEAAQHYYTGETVNVEVIQSPGYKTRATLQWGQDIIVSTRDGVESAVFTLPEGGCRYTFTYSTYTNEPGNYSNEVGSEEHWRASGTATVVAEIPTVEKSVSGADDEYIYFYVEANIPGSQYEKRIMLYDQLTGDGKQFVNEPEILELAVYNQVTGVTDILSPYVDGGPVERTYKFFNLGAGQLYRWRICFATERYGGNATSSWPYSDDSTIKLTYRVARSTLSTDGSTTIGERLKGSYYLNNSIEVNYGYDWLSVHDEVRYNEASPSAKKGYVANTAEGILSYRVVFSNNYFSEGVTDAREALPLLNQDFSNAYFHDEPDSRCEYVDGSMYVLLYDRAPKAENSIINTFGLTSKPIGVFRYDGEISGSEIAAAWSDFAAFDYRGQFEVIDQSKFMYQSENGTVRYSSADYRNLEQLVRTFPGKFGLVFIYDVKVKDQYRQVLDDTGAVLTLHNEADVGWDLPQGSYTTEPVYADVAYDTKLLDKECIHVGEEDTVKYVITVNSYGYDLTEGSTFTLEDTMCDDLTLYLASLNVEVKTDSEDEWVPYNGDAQVAYDAVSNTIRLTIPDDCPVRISYDCRINKTGEVNLYNTVKILGYGEVVQVNEAEFEVAAGQGASGSGSTYVLYIRKNDAEDHTALNGAVFALYGNNLERASQPEEGIPASKTVNGETVYYYGSFVTADHSSESAALNGTFLLSDNYTDGISGSLETGGHYALAELRAPEGYDLSNEVFDFYWISRPREFIECIPVFEDGYTLVIDNEMLKYILPETGGTGTTNIIIVGVAFIIGAVWLEIRRKRDARIIN